MQWTDRARKPRYGAGFVRTADDLPCGGGQHAQKNHSHRRGKVQRLRRMRAPAMKVPLPWLAARPDSCARTVATARATVCPPVPQAPFPSRCVGRQPTTPPIRLPRFKSRRFPPRDGGRRRARSRSAFPVASADSTRACKRPLARRHGFARRRLRRICLRQFSCGLHARPCHRNRLPEAGWCGLRRETFADALWQRRVLHHCGGPGSALLWRPGKRRPAGDCTKQFMNVAAISTIGEVLEEGR